MTNKSLFSKLGFLPYLGALFLNAFTDLGHKIIIQNTVFKIYDEQTQIILTAIINALILLPFILLFTPSGYISDKFPKHLVMKYTAMFSIVVTLLITLSYYLGLFQVAFGLTFLMAIQSAIYSPAKYGYIKELVGEHQISAGNAAVQAVTTVAILLGTIVFTIFFEMSLTAEFAHESDVLQQIAPLGWILVLNALIEFYLVTRLPNTMPKAIKKKFELKRYKNGYYLRKNLKTVTRKPEILRAILLLSIFWSLAQVFLSIFGAYAKIQLGIDNAIIVQGAMALSGIGIVAGSILAAQLSTHYIHKGLVPLGALLVTLSLGVFLFVTDMKTIVGLFLLFGIGFGMLIVPLNATIQARSPRIHLGTILAGNNFIQHILMILALLLTTLFAYMGLNSYTLFIGLFAVALLSGIYLIRVELIMFLWLLIEMVFKMRYKVVYKGLEHIPREGAVLLLGNHISWIDWLFVQFPLQRRMHFMMERSIYNWPLFNALWKLGGAIPMSSKASKDAFAQARTYIGEKKVVTIYPEGGISHSGEMGKFYRGFEMVAKGGEGHIIPYYIDGMYGSLFSRSKRHFGEYAFLRRTVTITFSNSISIHSSTDEVREIVENIKENNVTQ